MSEASTRASSVSSSIEVSVEPDVAFEVFTGEVDLWWVRGPINHHDAGRMKEKRIEPGVGGRVLEIYGDAEGDWLELARVTVWDPPRRLVWQSSIDDVETEIRFEPAGAGTQVTVQATVPPGGADRGGTAWVRVVGRGWFSDWCERRDREPHEVRDIARLALGISYARPAAAARFIRDVFGFRPVEPLPEEDDPLPEGDYGHPWIELRLGNSSLMVFKAEEQHQGTCGHEPWVYVDDVESHFRSSTGTGANIVEELSSPWGLPFYVAEDPEGNRWRFAQARPTMA